MSRKNFSQAHERLIQPGQVWLRPVGEPEVSREVEARVMAVADGYAMVRHKGCMPFAVAVKDMASWRLR